MSIEPGGYEFERRLTDWLGYKPTHVALYREDFDQLFIVGDVAVDPQTGVTVRRGSTRPDPKTRPIH